MMLLMQLNQYAEENVSDFAVDVNRQTVWVNAGLTLRRLHVRMREACPSLSLPSHTAGAFFAIGGVVSNCVHGDVPTFGLLQNALSKVRVINGKGEVLVIEREEDLRYYRSSLGMLGVITHVELRLVLRVDRRAILSKTALFGQRDERSTSAVVSLERVRSGILPLDKMECGQAYFMDAHTGDLLRVVFERAEPDEARELLTAVPAQRAGAWHHSGTAADPPSETGTTANDLSRETMSAAPFLRYDTMAQLGETRRLSRGNSSRSLTRKLTVQFGAPKVNLLAHGADGGPFKALSEFPRWRTDTGRWMYTQVVLKVVEANFADGMWRHGERDPTYTIKTSPMVVLMSYFIPVYNGLSTVRAALQVVVDACADLRSEHSHWNLEMPVEFCFVRGTADGLLSPIYADKDQIFMSVEVFTPVAEGGSIDPSFRRQDSKAMKTFFKTMMRIERGWRALSPLVQPHYAKLYGISERADGTYAAFDPASTSRIVSAHNKSLFAQRCARKDPHGVFRNEFTSALLAGADPRDAATPQTQTPKRPAGSAGGRSALESALEYLGICVPSSIRCGLSL